MRNESPSPVGRKKMKEDHQDSIYRNVSEEDLSEYPLCREILIETIEYFGAETEKLRLLLLRYMHEIEKEFTEYEYCVPKTEAPITPEAIRNLFIKLIAYQARLSRDDSANEDMLISMLLAKKIRKSKEKNSNI